MFRRAIRTTDPLATERGPRRHERGQALALFVLLMFVLLGMVAVVVDVSWLWSNRLHMQRAADAAALAGAVHLPGNPGTATTVARAEAVKNGYTNGANGITVTPQQSSTNPRQLNVTISGPVNWTFAQVFNAVDPGGWNNTTVTVRAKAQYVLPVPMGSPQNYFGVGHLVEASQTSSTTSGESRRSVGNAPSGSWTNAGNVGANDNAYASASNNGAAQQWGNFGFDSTIPSGATITGIRVRMQDLFLTGSGTATNCQVRAELSWNGGSSWSSVQSTTPALTTSTSADYDIGSSSSTSGWGSHVWTRSDVADAAFRVRLTWVDGTSSCASTQSINLDDLDIHINYTTTSTSWTASETPVRSPTGAVLDPHNFWAAMNSQGAPSVQGDAYMTYYDVRTGTFNCGAKTTPSCSGTDPDAQYLPEEYYNYGVEFPAGSSGGQLWIFDPGFCDAYSGAYGNGEFWTQSGANGNGTQPVSAYFDLWDTQGTPYNTEDDTLVASSNNTFRRLQFMDHSLYAAAGQTASQPDCGSQSWHHDWYQLASGLAGDTVYRLHTYSTDFGSPSDQLPTTAHNTFAFWATASGGTPRIYGIGAMEAYVRLPGGRASEFFLAQIEDVHAGKTLLIDLWDPGDTGNLSASLQILKPTAADYVPVTFNYSAAPGSTTSETSSCTRSVNNVNAVTTSTGGGSNGRVFNGCWLQISIQIPSDYDAPLPSTEDPSTTTEGGWWKIRYTMGGSASDFSTDLTTWQVGIRGSPVHLLP